MDLEDILPFSLEQSGDPELTDRGFRVPVRSRETGERGLALFYLRGDTWFNAPLTSGSFWIPGRQVVGTLGDRLCHQVLDSLLLA